MTETNQSIEHYLMFTGNLQIFCKNMKSFIFCPSCNSKLFCERNIKSEQDTGYHSPKDFLECDFWKGEKEKEPKDEIPTFPLPTSTHYTKTPTSTRASSHSTLKLRSPYLRRHRASLARPRYRTANMIYKNPIEHLDHISQTPGYRAMH